MTLCVVVLQLHIICLVVLPIILCTDTCTRKGACACETSKGRLDLTGLGNKDGTPQFKDLASPPIGNLYTYSWNPCYPFTEGPTQGLVDVTCVNVAGCQTGNFGNHNNLGKQSSSVFTVNDDGSITVTYTHKLVKPKPDILYSRQAIVKLTCGTADPGTVEAQGEKPAGSGKYYYEYTGKHACLKKKKKEKSSGGLSIGSMLCITFFVLLIVYVIAGVLVQAFYRKERGVALIPNARLWGGLMDLIKTGFQFVFCRHRMAYQQT